MTPSRTIATVGPRDWKNEAPEKHALTISEASPNVALPSRGAATRRGSMRNGLRSRTVSGSRITPTSSGSRKTSATT